MQLTDLPSLKLLKVAFVRNTFTGGCTGEENEKKSKSSLIKAFAFHSDVNFCPQYKAELKIRKSEE